MTRGFGVATGVGILKFLFLPLLPGSGTERQVLGVLSPNGSRVSGTFCGLCCYT